ncbi:multidrug ABC transporter ATPase [Methylacidiphilum kamchatkense Kam1]|uniref:ABC-type multidrug transport system fused ATPase/permease subunit n=1 Tax=Methylacidiphilum kamchatkense Kam1 TaxID=1202785 RepID=A0A0C1UU88_9BACT|nr:ABC transporter ATP-binding protein [Methylacidiphilum kamchatkense]KIE59323.1 multidrug ABC transporter ATPase [Methylacidiphilum kamchatkense Kam1]QDQ42706.1 ABC-type multidrug transport system fused ATPase/permease subunit [Methylacidiphilum kamchatkense Kam1]
MQELKKIIIFSMPFLKRRMPLILAGLISGFLFGAFNGAYLFILKAAIDNFSAPATHQQVISSTEKIAKKHFYQKVMEQLGRWLPKANEPLDWKRICGGILILPLIAIFRGLLRLLNSYFMTLAAAKIVADLQSAILSKLHSLSMDFFHKSTTGDLAIRILNDTKAFYDSVSVLFTDVAKDPITIIAILFSCALIDWRLTIVAILLVPGCIVPAITLAKKAREASMGIISYSVAQSNLLFESLSGIQVIKAFCLEKKNVETFRHQANELAKHAAKMSIAGTMVSPMIDVVASFALSLLILCVIWQNISIANMAAIANGAILFFAPIKRLADANVKIQEGAFSAKRLTDLLDTPSTVQEKPDAKAIKTFKKQIEFQNVTFNYGHETVIKNLSFIIPKGKKMGIAGRSGAGKTTLTSLLFRFYDPVSGSILIDGEDLRDLKIEDLRNMFSLVSQDVVIFNRSIAENIAVGKAGASREEIEQAAKQAGAHEFIEKLPQGYDTIIGERGVKLSGGQRQRLSIARAFIRNSPILILDEATSSLDSHSESVVQQAIYQLEKGRTVLIIAHRLSTLADCDEILVLDKGEIVQRGNFGELLAQEGLFRSMALHQGIATTLEGVAS